MKNVKIVKTQTTYQTSNSAINEMFNVHNNHKKYNHSCRKKGKWKNKSTKC